MPYPPCSALPPLHALRAVHGLELERARAHPPHGGKNIELTPAIVPLLDERVTSERIERGIAWLADNWRDVEPMLPRELAGR